MDVRTPVPTIYGDWPTRFGETWKTQVTQLKAKFGAKILGVQMPGESRTDVPIITVDKQSIVEIMTFLKNEPGFEYGFLADLTATDESPREPRFDVVYNLAAPGKFWRLRVKAPVAENDTVPTLISLWQGANWAEREVWDMFGIKFAGHPDLRRILMDMRWEGHPLRKDYPLRGYQIFPTAEPLDPELLK
ncbi:MAG: NADH-quinone oxidoreductase subunit C [Bacteriovoracia bacterium]